MSATTQPRISTPADAANRTVYEGGLLADQLGLLKARTAECKSAEEQVKVDLICMAANVPGSPVAFEGTQFRATVSFGTKKVVDYKAIVDVLREHCTLPACQIDLLIETFTQVAEGVPSVKVSARKSTH